LALIRRRGLVGRGGLGARLPALIRAGILSILIGALLASCHA